MRLLHFLGGLFGIGVLFACSESARMDDGADAGPSTDAGTDVVEQPEAREDANEIPCEPRRVLQTICQQCHTRPPQNGAPFPLVNRSDILMRRSRFTVRELMIQMLESRRMPLAPVTIEDADREILLDWLRDGAQAIAPSDCAGSGPSDAGPDAE